jgi:hypothetical protein
MSYEDDIPRRKRDPLKSFRDPKTEREQRYKDRLRIEEENRRREYPGKPKKKEED